MGISKIARYPVEIPTSVAFAIGSGGRSISLGGSGSITMPLPECVDVFVEGSKVQIKAKGGVKSSYVSAIVGTCVANLKQALKDVVNPSTLVLVLEGVGFKAHLADSSEGAGSVLIVNTRKSHLDAIFIPKGVKVEVKDKTTIQLSGRMTEIAMFADDVIRLRPWDPCRQNGVYKQGTTLRRKEGKKK